MTDVLTANPIILSEKEIDDVSLDAVPGVWGQVQYADLVQAAKGFYLWSMRHDDSSTRDLAARILKALACGYAHDHFEERVRQFEVLRDDPDRELKESALGAIRALRATCMDRLPWQFYFTLATLVMRPDPQQEVSILTIKERLGIPWTLADGLIHAAVLPTPLWEQVQSTMCLMTNGFRFQHGCDCSCATPYLDDGGEIRSFPYGRPQSRLTEAQSTALVYDTYSFLKHAFGQILILARDGLPFVMGAGIKAKQLGHVAFVSHSAPVE